MVAFCYGCLGVLLLAASCGIMTWVWRTLRMPSRSADLPDLASLLPRGLAALPAASGEVSPPASPAPNLYKERMEFLNMVLRERLEDQADKEVQDPNEGRGPIEGEAAVLTYNPGVAFADAPLAETIEDDKPLTEATE